MKASGSPCPLDKISIIPFKRCPFLRSYSTAVFNTIWVSGEIPTEWKKHVRFLHTKRVILQISVLIMLESIPLKICTSCLRDSMFAFLLANGFIEHEIQKGFFPQLTGTFERTAQMANVINTARIKQRSLAITLLDLKNAFGEVHHNLIRGLNSPEILLFSRFLRIKIPVKSLFASLFILTTKFLWSLYFCMSKSFRAAQGSGNILLTNVKAFFRPTLVRVRNVG